MQRPRSNTGCCERKRKLHKPTRKRFPRNPYTVYNVDDLCEMDMLDMGSLISHNDGHRYLLDAIDAFSNYVYSVPIGFK